MLSTPETLARALFRLDPRPRRLLERHALAGQSVDALAAELGVSSGAARQLLADAQEALAAQLPDLPREALVQTLSERGPEVEAALQAEARAWALAPARRLEDRARQLAFAVLLLLTAWFMYREWSGGFFPPNDPRAIHRR